MKKFQKIASKAIYIAVTFLTVILYLYIPLEFKIQNSKFKIGFQPEIQEAQAAILEASATVSTDGTSNVTAGVAILEGTISSLGGQNITQHGFAWGTSANLSGIGVSTTTLGAKSSTGAFSSNISALSCGTTYRFRAYAVNPTGIGYGSTLPYPSFTTDSCSVKFSVSEPVYVSSGPTINVRNAPPPYGDGALRGAQNQNAQGTVISGPVWGSWWWEIDFTDSTIDGWVEESLLAALAGDTEAPTVSITSPTASTEWASPFEINASSLINIIDFQAISGGTALGDTTFSFDCNDTDPYDYDRIITLTTPNPTAETLNKCSNYTVPGTYTARVKAERGVAPDAFKSITINIRDFSINVTPDTAQEIMDTDATGVTYNVNLTSLNNFNTPVTLSYNNCPTGATCSFTGTNPVTPPGNSTFKVTTNNVEGNVYPISVIGTGGGVQHSDNALLSVKFRDFNLFKDRDIVATLVAGQPGQSSTTTISVSPIGGGFDSDIKLSVDSSDPDLPLGTTFSFDNHGSTNNDTNFYPAATASTTLTAAQYAAGASFRVRLGPGITSHQTYDIVIKGSSTNPVRNNYLSGSDVLKLRVYIRHPDWREI